MEAHLHPPPPPPPPPQTLLQLPAIPDPTDWDSTLLPLLHPLDAALRCQICKDFFTAPVLTNCQHTFCSECIRRALHADKICPVCRAPEQEYRLRKNQVVEDLVDAFVAARPGVLEVARAMERARRGAAAAAAAVEEDEGEDEEWEGTLPSPPRKRRRGRGRGRGRGVVLPVSAEEEVAVAAEDGAADDDDEIVEVPSPDDGLVPCPSCNKRLKLSSVNTHLDACLSLSASPTTTTSSTTAAAPARRAPAPIPKINYSLMKEKELRAKLAALGIPSTGSRKALQERHSEWVTIWNANIDAKRPRTKIELLADLAARERANARPSNQIVKEKWSDEKWAAEHQPQFRRLAEEARGRRGTATATAPQVPVPVPVPDGGELDVEELYGVIDEEELERERERFLMMVTEPPRVFGGGVEGGVDMAQTNGKWEIDSGSSSSSNTPDTQEVTEAVLYM